jgi:hypothetical protein
MTTPRLERGLGWNGKLYHEACGWFATGQTRAKNVCWSFLLAWYLSCLELNSGVRGPRAARRTKLEAVSDNQ